MPSNDNQSSTGSLRKARCFFESVEQLGGEREHTETFNAVQELELYCSRGMGRARPNAAGLAGDVHHYLPGLVAYMQPMDMLHRGSSELRTLLDLRSPSLGSSTQYAWQFRSPGQTFSSRGFRKHAHGQLSFC